MKLTTRRQIYGGQPDPMEPTTPIAVTMQAQQWDRLLNMLADAGTYRAVAPLIAEIQQQCVQQGDGVPQTPTRYGNGDARDRFEGGVTHE